jgi:SAM-dependent methyltransferase
MLSYLFAILQSENPKYMLFQLLFLFALLYLAMVGYKNLVKPLILQEGFHQEGAYVLKRNSDIYDDFYADVYDEIHDTEDRSKGPLLRILDATEPTTTNSVFLDVGSGTGYVVEQLREAGYRAFGIDKSSAMVEYCERNRPTSDIKCGDVLDPMSFENSTFTHVLCTHFTIYEIENKSRLFQNCYHWLQPNGYLVLHLVDKAKFDRTMPMDNKTNLWKPLQRLYGIEPSETKVDFSDYQYHATYKNSQSNAVQLTETFTDKATQHVRQNESTFHMESIESILEVAKRNGFLVHAKWDMTECGGTDKHQYVYVLERIL